MAGLIGESVSITAVLTVSYLLPQTAQWRPEATRFARESLLNSARRGNENEADAEIHLPSVPRLPKVRAFPASIPDATARVRTPQERSNPPAPASVVRDFAAVSRCCSRKLCFEAQVLACAIELLSRF